MKRKNYAPVTEFERQTSFCPLSLAWRIVDEARVYFRTNLIPSSGSATFSHPMGEGQLADKLARRAEAVFAHHPFWQRRFQSVRGGDTILTAMRHWLAGVLAKENPVTFRQLPKSFKIGHPLPQKMVGSSRRDDRERRTPRRCVPTKPRFVHGCELLPV